MTATDVVVVGAGPVGLLVALLLGRRGHRVEVLERQAEPYGRPRAVHLDDESARILQSAGVMAHLEARTEPMDAYEWRSAAGETLLVLRGEGVEGRSGWPGSLMFCQPELEEVLEAALADLDNVTVRRGVEVTALVEASGAVEVAVRSVRPAAGAAVAPTVSARWAVGCDGARSVVRDALDIPVTDLGRALRWLVVDLIPAEPQRWQPLNVQLCDPARPTTAVSGGPGRRRFEFMQLPVDAPDDLERTATAWQLLEPWGFTPANASLERHATYTFGARMAGRWRRGRVLLAGDAAHQMPPFAGQGLCSGLRDAANLAWKLDLVLTGLGGEALVDTYGSERAAQVRTAIDFSLDLGKIICVLDPAEAAARDAAMIPAAAASGPIDRPPDPPLGPGATRPGDPHGGQLGRQAVVAHRGRTGRFDDVAAPGWVLLGTLEDPGDGLPGPLASWWAAIGGHSFHVGPGAPVDDVSGAYGRWFAELGVPVVLQRPDFYLFGAGPDAAALVAALQTTLQPGGES